MKKTHEESVELTRGVVAMNYVAQAFDLLFVVHDESKHKPMVFVTMASLTRQFGREYPEERPACASIARAEEVRHKFAIRCKQ